MSTPTPRRLRGAARGLVLDDADRILLVRLVFPEWSGWVPPGGGIEPDEDDVSALRRELAEETGLVGADVGPVVWRRRHEFPLVLPDGSSWDGQSETVRLVRTAHFDPAPHLAEAELRAEGVESIRWWTLEEIVAATGTVMFAPRELGGLIESILADGVPAVPFEIHQSG